MGRLRVGIDTLEAFWGRSNGGNDAHGVMADALRGLGLGPADCRYLRLNLPVPEQPGSTVAARITRCKQFLELLEHEVA